MITISSFNLTAAFWDVLIALFLGAAIGIERSVAHKTAGIRTYGLLSMGSCLFVLISQFIVTNSNIGASSTQIAAGIVTGLGFLCGGVIIFQDRHISGLTTAAGLWVSAGVGMAVGFGLTALAVFTTFVTLFAFTALWIVEQYVLGAKDKLQMLERHIDEP